MSATENAKPFFESVKKNVMRNVGGNDEIDARGYRRFDFLVAQPRAAKRREFTDGFIFFAVSENLFRSEFFFVVFGYFAECFIGNAYSAVALAVTEIVQNTDDFSAEPRGKTIIDSLFCAVEVKMIRNYAYARVRRRKKGRVGKKIFNRTINRRMMSDYRVRSDRNGVFYARARKVGRKPRF